MPNLQDDKHNLSFSSLT